ncbi:MAG: hypothetical protein EXS31_17520 [Pedosphaera sp.]|nr:hypothetical protein [Pedosphaera sp.]
MNAWKPIVAALVIFAAGVVTGGLTARLAAPARIRPAQNPPINLGVRPGRAEMVERMQRELSLTEVQRERIDVVVRESQERTRQLWEGIAPQAHAEHKRVRERIREELSPEQRTKFDESFRLREMSGLGRLGSDARDKRRPEERRGPRGKGEPDASRTKKNSSEPR